MQAAAAKRIIESFKDLPVLVIGDVMLDSYIWGSVDRISPEAPVPVVRVKNRDLRLGGAANVALNLQSLGAIPTVCALIGRDDAGSKLKELFGARKLPTVGLVESASRPTTIKTRVIASHQHVVRVDEESDAESTDEEVEQLWRAIEPILRKSRAVIFEDYDKGSINPALIEKTVSLANQLGIPTIVDPKRRNFLAYKNVTLFKPNLKELREGLKRDVSGANPTDVRSAVGQLMNEINAGVMVTLSEHGVYINYRGEEAQLPAHPREIADVSGAGDTVVSIAGLCVALGLPAADIAYLSNLGGGLVCQHVGVVPIGKEELISETGS
ncbi:MAG: bifunctional heptose 7-phosphate kinase/heptose 1-phosphate adenyltransferase [Cyclobacteriaceae bacterium]